MTTANINQLFTAKNIQSNSSMAGMYGYFPPNSTDMGVEWTKKDGGLLNRSTDSILWMQALRRGWVISETNWQAAKTLSYNGAVEAYSDGDGSTTFRKPDAGTHGAFSRAIGSGDGAVSDLLYATQDQIVNFTGEVTMTAGGANQGIINGGTGVFKENTAIDSLPDSPGGGTNTRYSRFTIDASQQVNTGDEVKPVSVWHSVWIHTGRTATQVVSNQPQVINRNVWLNSDLSINQRALNIGDVAHGEYFADRWRKVTDNTTMRQPVDASNYTHNTVYTISYSDGTVRQVTSPDSGNWDNSDLDVPVGMSWYKLEQGLVNTPWEKVDTREECITYYVLFKNISILRDTTTPSFQGGLESLFTPITIRDGLSINYAITISNAPSAPLIGQISLDNIKLILRLTPNTNWGAGENTTGNLTVDSEIYDGV